MKKIIIILCSLLTISCSGKYKLEPNSEYSPLKSNEGYLGLVINTLDPLYSIQMLNVDTDEAFYIGSVKKGISQITLQLQEGEYCFIGFDVYNLRVDYKDKGFCTYIEANELNYFSEFMVRDPITRSYPNYKKYIDLLRVDHPELCKQFVNSECSI
ncbi:hypothetical protein [Kangiella sp. M94]